MPFDVSKLKPWKFHIVQSLQFAGNPQLCRYHPDRSGLKRDIGYFSPFVKHAGFTERWFAVWQWEIGKTYMVREATKAEVEEHLKNYED